MGEKVNDNPSPGVITRGIWWHYSMPGKYIGIKKALGKVNAYFSNSYSV